MSKHRDRRERRERYHQMLDDELRDGRAEQVFTNRVIGTLDRDGLDFGPDGRRIKADFWRFIASRQVKAVHTALAGKHLVERAIAQIQVRHV